MPDILKKTSPAAAPSNDSLKLAPDVAAGDFKKLKPDAKNKDKHDKQLRPLQTYGGKVGEYGANPDGVYDRFMLEAAAVPTRTVKFPPYFGEALRALAQPGQAVAVLGFVHTTPKGDEHLHLAQVEAGGATARPLAPGPAEAVTVRGAIAKLLLNPKGHLHSLRLAGNDAELRLPPHLGQQLAKGLRVGTHLTASAAPCALAR